MGIAALNHVKRSEEFLNCCVTGLQGFQIQYNDPLAKTIDKIVVFIFLSLALLPVYIARNCIRFTASCLQYRKIEGLQKYGREVHQIYEQYTKEVQEVVKNFDQFFPSSFNCESEDISPAARMKNVQRLSPEQKKALSELHLKFRSSVQQFLNRWHKEYRSVITELEPKDLRKDFFETNIVRMVKKLDAFHNLIPGSPLP